MNVAMGLLLTLTILAKGVACPPEGDSASGTIQALDQLKNRDTLPARTVDVPVATFLAPGPDQERWSTHQGVHVTGIVALVKPGGRESANCHAADLAHRDTHIVLVAHPGDTPALGMIVEVTPWWRARMAGQGQDWSTSTLRQMLLHRCVSIAGWLLWDREHAAASRNTAAPGVHTWRVTAWEVHPVVSIVIEPMATCQGDVP